MYFRRYRNLVIFCALSIVCIWYLWFREVDRRHEETLALDEQFNNAMSVVNSKDSETFILVLIMTAPKSRERRDTIRETWLAESIQKRKAEGVKKEQDVKHLFVVGTGGWNRWQIESIEEEQAKHNDLLLLEGFADAYEKLTEKLGIMLMWVRDRISFKYVFKGDDDTFARIDVLHKELEDRYLHHPDEKLYYGYFYGRGQVKKKGAWKEPDWKLCDMYIPYARGGGYILSSNVVDYVANNYHLLKRYVSEDVSLGSWLAPLNLTRFHDRRFDTEYKTRGCSNSFVVSHKQTIEDMTVKHKNLITTGKLCEKEFSNFPGYEYNWAVPPSQCCERTKGIP